MANKKPKTKNSKSKGKDKDPEVELIAHLRFKKYYYAADEVTIGNSRADVLALDKNARNTIELEFKRSSHDLKVLENKKKKNTGRGWGNLKPNRFFFVMPMKLWKKECTYLKEKAKEQGFGVLVYFVGTSRPRKLTFMTFISSKLQTGAGVTRYDIAERAVLSRVTSAYARLLMLHYRGVDKWL